MEIPILSYTWAAREKGRWGRITVLVASSCQVSLVGKPCLLLPPPLPPPNSEPLPPSLTPAIALIISNYTWSHVLEISNWPDWKVTWQKKKKETTFLLPQHKLMAQLQVWKEGKQNDPAQIGLMYQGRHPAVAAPWIPKRPQTSTVLLPSHSYAHSVPPPVCHYSWLCNNRMDQPLEMSIWKFTIFLIGCFHLYHLRIQDHHTPRQNRTKTGQGIRTQEQWGGAGLPLLARMPVWGSLKYCLKYSFRL